MANRNYTLLLTLTSGFFLLLLLLTDTHTGFSCQIEQESDEKNGNCETIGLTMTKDEICVGHAFIIHINLTPDKDQDIVKIVCPWSSQSAIVLTCGVAIALLYTIPAIFQRKKKSIIPGKALVGIGVISLCLIGAAAVSMGLDILGGLDKCNEFVSAIESEGVEVDKDCSTALYLITIAFSIVSLGLLAYEIFLGYERYKSDQLFIEAGEQGIYIPKGDFNQGLFKEDPSILDEQ